MNFHERLLTLFCRVESMIVYIIILLCKLRLFFVILFELHRLVGSVHLYKLVNKSKIKMGRDKSGSGKEK